jgi:hypothetical protein
LVKRTAAGGRNLDLAMWMVAAVSDAVIHRAVVERPRELADGSIADELVAVLVRYLNPPAR